MKVAPGIRLGVAFHGDLILFAQHRYPTTGAPVDHCVRAARRPETP